MIEYLCRHLQTKAFVVTEIEDKRRVPAGELGEIFKRYATCPVYVKADVKDAIACAYEMRTKETYIYCIGSLYLAGRKGATGGGDVMLNYEEELKKFQPSLEVEDIEEAVYREDLTDMQDIIREAVEQTK